MGMINTFLKSTHLIWKILRTFLFLIVLIYSIAITAFSGFASMIGAGLSMIGITTASAQLTADLVEAKAARKKATTQLKEMTAKEKKLANELSHSKAKQKKLTEELSKIKISQKKLAAEAADLRATRKAVSEATQSAANRSVRLIKSNIASEGLDWIPIVGVAIGAVAVGYEIKEICGQLDDMDKISKVLGDKPADRGGLGYLCSGKHQGILYRGNFFKSLSDNEIWPYEVRALHNRYTNLLLQGGFFDDLPTLEGVSFSNLDKPDYFIYETANYILIEDSGIFSNDYYLHKKE